MVAILVTGYKDFELGIFQNKDKRIDIIKKAIRHHFINYLEDDVDWLIFTGNLGFEYWALQVAKELQKDYDFKIATLFMLETHGNNWNENNQRKLLDFKQVDFVKYVFQTYENASQFKQYNRFLVDNTEKAYLFYDSEKETNLNYLLQEMKQKKDYVIDYLTFDYLNELLDEQT